MQNNNKKIKRIVTAIVLLVLVIAGLSGLKVRSVGQYKQEQKQLAKDLFVTDSPTESSLPQVSGDGLATEIPETAVPSSAKPQKTPKATAAQTSGAETATSQVSGKTDKSKGTKAKRSEKSVANKQTHKPSAKQTSSPVQAKATPKPSGQKQDSKKDEQVEDTCTITIRCDTLLDHKSELSEAVKKKIPAKGMILEKTTVKITSTETAYSILQKVCKASGIHLDAEYSSAFSTEYVQGIGELYEKEAGDMSGWLYTVNGKLPNIGASRYQISPGDTVEWVYTCDGTLP